MLPDKKCYSRFLGKDVLPPFKEPTHSSYRLLKEQKETRKEKRYVNFIIGIDEEGNYIEYTCDPNKLSNSFEADFESPRYLTPVFFKREVLKKYYDKPSKYSVEDNYIRCGNLWGIRYGQNSSGLVHAWLGDLGRDLPYNEQLHWKQYNVPPEGGVGKLTVKRELLAEFADSDEITHIFKNELEKFNRHWRSKMGWDLFLPLRKEDIHFFKSLHWPTSEDPLEFELQILSLAKILPDSINVSELKKLIKNTEKTQGSIDLLEKVLISHFKIEENKAKKLLQPLRDIQALRSASTAHRKGNKYEKTIKRLELYGKSYISFLKKMLEDIVNMLRQLRKVLDTK